jgi:hypothetical protein
MNSYEAKQERLGVPKDQSSKWQRPRGPLYAAVAPRLKTLLRAFVRTARQICERAEPPVDRSLLEFLHRRSSFGGNPASTKVPPLQA